MPRHLWVFLGVLLAALGLTCALLAWTFSNLAPLSGGFRGRAVNAALVGGLLFTAGTTLTLTMLVRKVRSWKTSFLYAAALPPLVGWCLFGTLFYLEQDRLLFNPRGLSEARYAVITREYPRAQEVHITVGEHTLHGWLLPAALADAPTPLILVFYGQGGEASRYLTLAERVPEAAWAFVNYRGYGWSTGFPSERAFFTDAVAVYDYFYTHPLVDADRIVALGGSLGTGVAAYLAAQRALRGVVLFSPYDSISGGVARDLIPLLPTSWLMHNHFHAAQFARNASAPALAVIGEADAVIRPERSLALMEAWAQPAQTFVIPDGTHYSIYDEEASWNAVRAFLADLGII